MAIYISIYFFLRDEKEEDDYCIDMAEFRFLTAALTLINAIDKFLDIIFLVVLFRMHKIYVLFNAETV